MTKLNFRKIIRFAQDRIAMIVEKLSSDGGLFRAAPVAYGSSQAKGQTGDVVADLHHSHSNASNARDLSCVWTYTTAHGNAGSLTHWARPRTEPATSCFSVGFVNHCATTGTPRPTFKIIKELYPASTTPSLDVILKSTIKAACFLEVELLVPETLSPPVPTFTKMNVFVSCFMLTFFLKFHCTRSAELISVPF